MIKEIMGTNGHPTAEGLAVYLESIQGRSMSALPEELQQHIEHCEECRQCILEMLEIIDVEQKHTGYHKKLKIPFPRWRFPAFYSYAATMLILLGLSIVFILNFKSVKSTGKEIFSQSFSPYPDVLARKDYKSEDLESQLIAAGLAFYNSKEYDSAVFLLGKGDTLFPLNPAFPFYCSMSVLASGKSPQSAISLLQRDVYSLSVFKEPAKWYLALAYLQNNQYSSARPYLIYLSSYSADFGENARKILKKLP